MVPNVFNNSYMYITCSDFNNTINKKYVDKTSSLLVKYAVFYQI